MIIEILNNGSFNKWDNFYEKNLTDKRPDIGLLPMKRNKIIGKK